MINQHLGVDINEYRKITEGTDTGERRFILPSALEYRMAKNKTRTLCVQTTQRLKVWLGTEQKCGTNLLSPIISGAACSAWGRHIMPPPPASGDLNSSNEVQLY